MVNTLRTNCELSAADQEALAVELLYAESANERTVQFEDHLAECDDCALAFASIAHARLDVAEWQSVEFAPLSTPKIDLPLISQPHGFAGVVQRFANSLNGLAWRPIAAVSIMIAAIGASAIFLARAASQNELALTAAKPADARLLSIGIPYGETQDLEADVIPPSVTSRPAAPAKRNTVAAVKADSRVKRKEIREPLDLDERNDIADGSLRLSVLFDELDAS